MIFSFTKDCVRVEGIQLERPMIIGGKNQKITLETERIMVSEPFKQKTLSSWVLFYDYKFENAIKEFQ